MFITLLTNKAAHPFFKLLFFPGFNKRILLLINPHFFYKKMCYLYDFFFWGGEGGGAIVVSRPHIVIFQYNYIIHRLQSQASTACFLATSLLRDEWKEELRGTSRRGPGGQLLIEKKNKSKKKKTASHSTKHLLSFFYYPSSGKKTKQHTDRCMHSSTEVLGFAGEATLDLKSLLLSFLAEIE